MLPSFFSSIPNFTDLIENYLVLLNYNRLATFLMDLHPVYLVLLGFSLLTTRTPNVISFYRS